MSQAKTVKATAREWWGLVVLILPTILLSVDMTVLHLAAPAISADMHLQGDQLLWILDIYGFCIASLLITMGALGDRYGRRRILLWGGFLFALASVLAAFAPTASSLIMARAALGVAGATLMPSTLSLIRVMFEDERERGFALSVWISGFMIGGSIGPLVGGVLLEFFWWGSVFLIAVPIMLLLLVFGPKLLPEYRDPSPAPLDMLSVLLSITSLLSLIYVIKYLALRGIELWLPGLLLVGLVSGALFVRRQQRLAAPLVELTLFANPRFSASIACTGLSILALSGIWYLVFQYLQGVLRLSPLESGLVVLPSMVLQLVASLSMTGLRRLVAADRLIVGGLLLALLGLLAIALGVAASHLVAFIIGTILSAVGLMPIMVMGTDYMLGAVPMDKAGVASAISETGNELGIALGVALLGTLAGFIYRREVLLTEGVPEHLRLLAADGIAVLTGDETVFGEHFALLFEVASSAFRDAFLLNLLLGCGLMLLVMVVAKRYLLSVPVPPSGLH